MSAHSCEVFGRVTSSSRRASIASQYECEFYHVTLSIVAVGRLLIFPKIASGIIKLHGCCLQHTSGVHKSHHHTSCDSEPTLHIIPEASP